MAYVFISTLTSKKPLVPSFTRGNLKAYLSDWNWELAILKIIKQSL